MPHTGKNKQKFWTSQKLPRPEIRYNLELSSIKLTEVYTQEFYSISTGMLQSESQNN